MPQYRCVPQCKNASAGHTFPRNKLLRQRWNVAIRRIDPVTKKVWEPGKRKRLKPDAVPSIFKFSGALSASSLRRKLRHEKKTISLDCVGRNVIADIGNEVELETESPDPDITAEEPIELTPKSCDAAVECSLLSDFDCRMSVRKYENNPRAVQYYTGMDDYNHFMLIFNLLCPAVYHLDFKCTLLELVDQLFLVLMKLRQAKEDRELSILFSISESTVSFLVNKWINFLYFQLKEISLWPPKSVVQQTMPKSFAKQFGSTRVVLDATEVPIAKPAHVNAQSVTFSTYKNRNTLKTMIGCTPRGLVSFVSESYEGSASDRQIIERSALLNGDMFSPNDSIMADRGILVQDLFANQDVFVNTPTMLKGKSQLEPTDVIHDRRIASKRIHVERVIGLGKTFKILRKELPASLFFPFFIK
ncbi:uncharacterized protein LOC135470158 isoform X2 [Liolophura sinensis]|uniref:uncharacterized protein LOC135470158 isoform X2 n=1 Tax=Liolophura sinensis TaxID=3198878 RepID=UPI0031580420